MKKIVRVLFLMACVTATSCSKNDPAPGPKPEETLSCEIGAFLDQNDDGMTEDEVGITESKMGRSLANIMFYTDFGDGVTNNFPIANFNFIKVNNNSIPWLKWQPQSSAKPGASLIDGILAGNYDNYLDAFAASAKNLSYTFWLDFAHEMNGDWYVWSGAQNGGSAGGTDKYKSMYRYVHDRFKAAGVTNIRWVWSPNTETFPNESWNEIADYYPGDDYVDYMGMDGYDWHGESFDGVFNGLYTKLKSISAKKPVVISEFACQDRVDKSAWIEDAFSQIKNNYKSIRAFNWFNVNKEKDWRLNSPAAGNAVIEALKSDYFISASDGPEPAPDVSESIAFKDAATTVKSANSYTLHVTYESSVDRTIACAMFDSNWTLLGESHANIQAGTGTVDVTVNLASLPAAATGYKFKCELRVLGGDWTTTVKEQILDNITVTE
jgi:hypothetical protein